MTSTAVERPRGDRHRKQKPKALRDQEAVQAFEMYALGRSTWEIARELGVSVQTACNRIEAARELITVPKIDAARELSLRTLNVARTKLLEDWSKLNDSADQSNGPGRGKIEHSPKFAEALVKIEAQMDKLQGLARPVKIEADVTVTHKGGVDAELDELTKLLGLNDDPAAPTEATDDHEGADHEQ